MGRDAPPDAEPAGRGRRTSSRAAYLFSRSVNDSEQRCKYAAKYLAYRLPSERDVEKDADAAERMAERIASTTAWVGV